MLSHSGKKGALTQTNRKSSLCLSYLEEQLAKMKLDTGDNGTGRISCGTMQRKNNVVGGRREKGA